MKYVNAQRAVWTWRRSSMAVDRDHHGAGNPGGQRELSDAEDLKRIRTTTGPLGLGLRQTLERWLMSMALAL